MEISQLSMDIFSPAKINLFLAITGKREDGFHELYSLFSRINLYDRILLKLDQDNLGGCSISSSGIYKIPLDETNSMARAVNIIRSVSGFKGSVNIHIHKKIPGCAGLGGGSSNGACVFLSLLKAMGHTMDTKTLLAYLAKIGSDCPFFSKKTPQLVSGRGDILTDLDSKYVDKIHRLKFVLFKPNIDISTAWAYGQLSGDYTDKQVSNELMTEFLICLEQGKRILIYNDFNAVVFGHYPTLAKLKNTLADNGVDMSFTGSGSACLVNFNTDAELEGIASIITAVLGKNIFMKVVTCL